MPPTPSFTVGNAERVIPIRESTGWASRRSSSRGRPSDASSVRVCGVELTDARASLAISGRGRAYSVARAGTGRTERLSARATAERPHRDRPPTAGSQAAPSRHMKLTMCSFRDSLPGAAQPPIKGARPGSSAFGSQVPPYSCGPARSPPFDRVLGIVVQLKPIAQLYGDTSA